MQLPVEQQEHIAVYHYDIDYEREELEEMMEEADNELDYSAGSTSTGTIYPVLSLMVTHSSISLCVGVKEIVREQFIGVGSLLPPWMFQGCVMWHSGVGSKLSTLTFSVILTSQFI